MPSLGELLAGHKIDVVHICTPHHTHVPLAVEALRHGCHVVLEKPPAISLDDLAALEAAVGASDRSLGVCFQNRFNLASQQARHLLETGKLEPVRTARAFVTWKRDAAYYGQAAWRGRWATEGGGVLINQAIHTLDLVALFGGGVRSVSARVETLGHDTIEVDDVASVVLDFQPGGVGSFVATTCAFPGSPVRIEVLGTLGSAAIVGEELVRFETKDGHNQPPPVDEGNGRLAAHGKDYYGSSHGLVIEDYIAAIREGRDPLITGEEGIKSVEHPGRHLQGGQDAPRAGRGRAGGRPAVGRPARGAGSIRLPERAPWGYPRRSLFLARGLVGADGIGYHGRRLAVPLRTERGGATRCPRHRPAWSSCGAWSPSTR